MLILISPAKTLDYQSPLTTTRYTLPELLDNSQQLIHGFIIENRLTKPEQLTGFNSEGYFFDEDSSSNGELVFKRYEQR
ncbi:hypothetical protein WMB93_001168 [Shigella flexneri]|nr:hypothetical protein [Shigella flexneri]